jgi:uncharacterized protein YkwD
VIRPDLRLASALALAGCMPSESAALPPPLPEPAPVSASAAPSAEPAPSNDPDVLAWVSRTSSPRPPEETGLAAKLGALCARRDGALDRVAERLAHRLLAHRAELDPAELTLELRAAGAPFVWPRSWSYSGATIEPADAGERAQRWLGSFGDGGERTCGAADLVKNGQHAVTLVAADALGDLDAIPSRARVGQWLDVRATLLVPASEAKVVVLGPHGAPHSIPTSLDHGVVQARFAPSSPGTWLVQLVAVIDSGPRPALEALVYADVEPPTTYSSEAAPGEAAGRGAKDDADSIFAMVQAVRTTEGLRPLARDGRLDEAATIQARAMRDSRTLGHDVGRGTVKERLDALGVSANVYGENVARAASPERAHRVIWASPSHRGNLLEPRFDAIGIGTARGTDGVWVCEVFADLR